MKNPHCFLIIIFSILATVSLSQPLQTVPKVDINKYIGKWYLIASLPQWYQKNCNCITAEYTLTKRGYLSVEYKCNKDSVNGKQAHIRAKAFMQENCGNAKVSLQFLWPFRYKVWIIELADDYSYTAIAQPDKKFLWILSRTGMIKDATYKQVISKMKDRGFDIAKIKLNTQIQNHDLSNH